MDHYFDSHSVLLLRERLERKRLRQWLRLQQRLRRLLLTGHDIEDAINKNIPWVPHEQPQIIRTVQKSPGRKY